MLEKVVINLIKEAIDKNSKDNISCIFLCMENLYNVYKEKDLIKVRNSIERLNISQLDCDNLYPDFSMKYIAHNSFVDEKSDLIFKNENISTITSKFRASHKKPSVKKKLGCCGIFS